MGSSDTSFDHRIAARLRGLRQEKGWSLDELAARCAISRATLSRLENAEVSGTAAVLGRLCAAYGMPMSRLMRMVEEDFSPLIRHAEQEIWQDRETGFTRRSVSPPAQALAGEVIEGNLKPGALIEYEMPSRPGLEHHLVMLEGKLILTVDAQSHRLEPGDCLRYRINGPSAFHAGPEGARYFIFIV